MSRFTLLNHVIDASYLNIEMIWVGMRSPMVKKILGQDIPVSFCECINGDTLKYFQDKSQAEAFSNICARAIISDRKLLFKIKTNTESLTNEILELGKDKYDFAKMSEREMLDLFKKTYKLQSTISAWGMPIAFADINGDISNKLSQIMTKRKNLKHPYSLYIEILGNPRQSSLTEKAYQAVLKSDNYNYLQKKYFWLDQGYVGLGLSKRQIKEIKKTKKPKKEKKLISKKELINELNLSLAEVNLFQVSADMVYLKALRGDSRQALHVLTNQIIKEVAKRYQLEQKYLHLMSSQELMDFLTDENKLPQDLSLRLQHCIMIPVDKSEYKILVEKNQIDKFLKAKIELSNKISNKNKSFSGQVAQPGLVRGKACLILDARDNPKINPGEILVSISTSPQLLPAMKKASAFVTAMGGITSHAAIVSRELKKPCIVGVKAITSILKDGDLIEVDANKGVVKLIKSVYGEK
jgi:phosphohistidine swiveling domain-containing protein